MSESNSDSSSVSERILKRKHEHEDDKKRKALEDEPDHISNTDGDDDDGDDDDDDDDGDDAIMNDDDNDGDDAIMNDDDGDDDDGDDAIMNDDDDADGKQNDDEDKESELKPKLESELQLVPTSVAIAVKKEAGSRDERRKQSEKKFTAEDEKVILESLIESGFRSGSKEYWSKVSVYLPLKLSHTSFTYTQVYEKIRRLKKRYISNYPNPPIGGEMIQGVSTQLWEEEARLVRKAVKVEEEDDADVKKKIVVKVEAEIDDNKEKKRKRKKKKVAGDGELKMIHPPNDNDNDNDNDGYDVKLEKLVRELQEQDPKFPVELTLDHVPRGSQKRMLQNQWNQLNAQFLTLHRAKAHLTQQTLDALVPSFPSHH